jgi:hypothetical protein
MNCRLTKLFALFVFAIAAYSFTASAEFYDISQFGYHAAHPIARLFQLLFILFIISPPLIVVMLYLIWKELKDRNK